VRSSIRILNCPAVTLGCENTIETRRDHKDESSLIADVRFVSPAAPGYPISSMTAIGGKQTSKKVGILESDFRSRPNADVTVIADFRTALRPSLSSIPNHHAIHHPIPDRIFSIRVSWSGTRGLRASWGRDRYRSTGPAAVLGRWLPVRILPSERPLPDAKQTLIKRSRRSKSD